MFLSYAVLYLYVNNYILLYNRPVIKLEIVSKTEFKQLNYGSKRSICTWIYFLQSVFPPLIICVTFFSFYVCDFFFGKIAIRSLIKGI